MAAKSKKIVQVIARYQFKSDSKKVVYLVRASDGIGTYETSFYDGVACSCTCKARGMCYHKTQLTVIEAARKPAVAVVSAKSITIRVNASLGAPLVSCGVKPVEVSAAHRATAPYQPKAFSLLRV